MAVLDRIEEGHSAHSVVIQLVREALSAADGFLADPAGLVAKIDQATSQASGYAASAAEAEKLGESLLGEVRVCLLYPARPAQDLLEDLLAGIYGCWLMYLESSDLDSDAAEREFIAQLRRAAARTLPD